MYYWKKDVGLCVAVVVAIDPSGVSRSLHLKRFPRKSLFQHFTLTTPSSGPESGHPAPEQEQRGGGSGGKSSLLTGQQAFVGNLNPLLPFR